MLEPEMRRVILSRAYEGPGACKVEDFGRCACDQTQGECVHMTALHWNNQIHNPNNYEVRQFVDREFLEHNRPDMKELFDKACIGLSRGEIETVGSALLEYIGVHTHR